MSSSNKRSHVIKQTVTSRHSRFKKKHYEARLSFKKNEYEAAFVLPLKALSFKQKESLEFK